MRTLPASIYLQILLAFCPCLHCVNSAYLPGSVGNCQCIIVLHVDTPSKYTNNRLLHNPDYIRFTKISRSAASLPRRRDLALAAPLASPTSRGRWLGVRFLRWQQPLLRRSAAGGRLRRLAHSPFPPTRSFPPILASREGEGDCKMEAAPCSPLNVHGGREEEDKAFVVPCLPRQVPPFPLGGSRAVSCHVPARTVVQPPCEGSERVTREVESECEPLKIMSPFQSIG